MFIRGVFAFFVMLAFGQAFAAVCITDDITSGCSPAIDLSAPGGCTFYEVIGNSEVQCELPDKYKDRHGRYKLDAEGRPILGGGHAPTGDGGSQTPPASGGGSAPSDGRKCFNATGGNSFSTLKEACASGGYPRYRFHKIDSTHGRPVYQCLFQDGSPSYFYAGPNGQCDSEPDKPKDGQDGEKGEQGEKGDKGEQGEKGEDGQDGQDGKDAEGGGTVNNTTNNTTNNNTTNVNQGSGEGKFEDKNDVSDFCKANPKALACLNTEGLEDDGGDLSDLIPRKEIPISFNPSNGILGQAGAGVCPAPETVSLRYWTFVLDWTSICQFLAKIRGIIIMMFSVMGFFVIMRGMK